MTGLADAAVSTLGFKLASFGFLAPSLGRFFSG
jgi:hypothetical protein